MSAQPIPATWLQAVTAHLRARGARVQIKPTCLTRWTDDFPGATVPELLHDFEEMFALTLHGCPVTMDPPAPMGVTWEFWFTHRKQKVYGKILLRADGRGIVVYSAHLPIRKHLDCERTSP